MFVTLTSLAIIIASASSQPLRSIASEKGLCYIGAAVNEAYFTQESYRTTAAEQYNLVTAENSCKFGSIQPTRGEYNFQGCDSVLDFAVENGMQFRGHNFIWARFNPGWLEDGDFDSDELVKIMTDHINTVGSRYKNKTIAWDVVNEALNDEDYGLRDCIWANITATESYTSYVDLAFTLARAADPQAKLFYNDYNVASSTGWSKGKSDAMFEMVKGMLERGVPIDGVGLQMHVGCGYDMFDGVRDNMNRYHGIGIEVHITELDLACEDKPEENKDCVWGDEAQEEQAETYASLLEICVESEACTNFETWGFTDEHTWLDEGTHPLPFDEEYEEKFAVKAMRDVLLNA